MTEDFDDRKARASAWFRALRDRIVAGFEALEDAQTTGPFADRPAGRFTVTETRRDGGDGGDAGGGLMSVLRDGRVFEKVGVNVSTVGGAFSPEFAKSINGAADDPRFCATGISLVARTAQGLCVHPSLPVNDMAQFLAHVRANPGQVNFSSAGIGR